MYLDHLTCTGFRCLQKIDFEPGPRINLVRGGNAQGKTSLLEAILFASTSKSHRTNVESELAAHGESGFSIKMKVCRRDREVILEANWHEGTKRFRINGVRQSRVSDILGTVSVVFFSPEDIALVKGSAAVRRKFLDMELSQLNPLYLAALQRYRQALRQRNELLRARTVDLDQLKAWDQQLAEHGEVLRSERSGFITELSERAREAYARISGGEMLALEYRSDVGSGDARGAAGGGAQHVEARRDGVGRARGGGGLIPGGGGRFRGGSGRFRGGGGRAGAGGRLSGGGGLRILCRQVVQSDGAGDDGGSDESQQKRVVHLAPHRSNLGLNAIKERRR